MSNQHRPISEIMVGVLILFSAILLSIYMLQSFISGQSDAFEAIPTFGFCCVLFLLALAQITGSRTFLQFVWLIIGIGLFALGIIVVFKWSLPSVLAVRETENWKATPCNIVISEVSIEKKADGIIRHPNIRYTYYLDGQSYESNIIDVFWTPINSGMNAQEIVNKFPVDKIDAVCWVNPKNKNESSLQKGWQTMHYVAFLPIILILPGLAMIIASFWRRK